MVGFVANPTMLAMLQTGRLLQLYVSFRQMLDVFANCPSKMPCCT